MRKLRCASFFAGVGGIDMGFEKTGFFETVYANEFDSYPVKTYEENFNSYVLGENLIPAQALVSPGFSVCCYGEYVDEDGVVRKRLPTETIDILLKPSGPISGNSVADSQTKADAFALAERAIAEIQAIKEHLNI